MENRVFDEHPVPSWARRRWISLDGEWQLRRRGRTETIIVPFPIGSPASGVSYADRGRFIYSRLFDLPPLAPDKTYLLRLGAVDYETTVIVNGKTVGRHVGGYASFTFDIGPFVQQGANSLELRVRDSRSMTQVRGKQTFLPFPFAVWYRGTTGVWQSVWIEETGRLHLRRASLDFDFKERRFVLEASADAGRGEDLELSAELVSPGGKTLVFESMGGQSAAGDGTVNFSARLDADGEELERWSPDHPALYALRWRLFKGGRLVDEVESYAGFRELDWSGKVFRLNGVETMLRMALVQGYYPEGGYAPVSTDVMEADIRSAKEMGFNGIRVHQKIESPCFHYLCDRLGILTTFEMPSFYRPSKRGFKAYEAELREVLDRDRTHPSCVLRMLFNETWGIWGIYGRRSATRRFVLDMVSLVKRLDPSRPVIDNSGWEHLETDIVDVHHYLGSAERARAFYDALKRRDEQTLFRLSIRDVITFYVFNRIDTRTRALYLDASAAKQDAPLILSEYGGFGWYKIDEGGTVVDLIERYTRDCLDSGLFAGYCLTQLYDVETETNGLLTFDRKTKVAQEHMKRINNIEWTVAG